ncbi:MAG: SRPBCC family protein [Saprospiraceae bacterium]
MEKTKITIQTTIHAPIDRVWNVWNTPEHITKWATASPDWHTPHAENDLRVGGKFMNRMEAKDGSFGFDFGGTFDVVDTNERIAYMLDDNRTVDTHFSTEGGSTTIVQTFEAENENPIEMQRDGWQAILDNCKAYAETN